MERPIRILAVSAYDVDRLTFMAEDEAGEVSISVPVDMYERLKALAPPPFDPEDMREFALMEIEMLARSVAPVETASGRLILLAPTAARMSVITAKADDQ